MPYAYMACKPAKSALVSDTCIHDGMGESVSKWPETSAVKASSYGLPEGDGHQRCGFCSREYTQGNRDLSSNKVC